MAASIRLQDLINISGSVHQDKRDAADVGAYRHVVIQVRVPKFAGTSGTLKIQQSNSLEDEAFVDVSGVSVDLTQDGNVFIIITDPGRYLRWRVENVSTDASFLIDLVVR